MQIVDKSGTEQVKYSYTAYGKVVSVTGAMASTLGKDNPMRYRGYYYDEESGYYYLQSRYYDPEIGRFISPDAVMGVNQDIHTYNLYVYCGNNPVNRYDDTGMFWKELISGTIHTWNSFAIAIDIDTAVIAAFFLDMQKDGGEVYHAKFDCWQQYFGYNDLYDYVFDLGTSMKASKFNFPYNGNGYTIWAWKGDYIALGAGAELGIYRGSDGHRTVDKDLAMRMGMVVNYKGNNIIDYGTYTWWITGFNPDYQNVQKSDLAVAFVLVFDSSGMYRAFRNTYIGRDPRWEFFDIQNCAVLKF